MNKRLNIISPGDKIGPYRIVRGFEGRGGMGGVFEVKVREKYHRPNLPDRLALKVAKEEYQGALVAEADYLQRFDHPNVVRIYPIAGYHKPVYAARTQLRSGWAWYYTMELVKGGSLEERLTRPTTVTDLLRPAPEGIQRLNVLEAVGVGRQIAAALEHIHQHKVINLDVKPGNILFRKRQLEFLKGSVPQAVLCDFGISRDARYPRAGMLGVATPEYVSPEQASEMGKNHKQVDPRSDIFSLGVLLYETLTGRLPFKNIGFVCDANYTPPPPSQFCPSMPDRLEAIVMRALARNPEHRFQKAREMRQALEKVPTPPDWKAAARRTFTGVTLAACVVTGGWSISRCRGPSTPQATRTSTITPSKPPVEATETPTLTPSSTPTAPSKATSTPAPTLTPTNTYPPPPTLTPTGEPEQEGN